MVLLENRIVHTFIYLFSHFCAVIWHVHASVFNSHFAQDQNLIKAMKADIDVLKDVASQIFNKQYSQVSSEERQRAKSVLYGMLYGQSIQSMAQDLKIKSDEALSIMSKFKLKYPKSASCLEDVILKCRANGFVRSLLNRQRFFKHIMSDNNMLRLQAERSAVNTLCQSSAADVIKCAMVKIHSDLIAMESMLDLRQGDRNCHYNTSFRTTSFQRYPNRIARLVLQIHDELLFEVKSEYLPKVANNMENCLKLHVPLKARLQIGKSWGDLKMYKPSMKDMKNDEMQFKAASTE
ncbi:DNA polymerase theta isoform 1 [Reticulomyxa filosa]|uniref:DNA-directed DNA polymerase n=1 Tax=Reticulomyxa filosa TaxID=46433 RepID=X6NFX0_RETFI|nr:DNA polymerase theta isoform 1 [Reticulomyxa filosa]|eukprot:ETO24237.1 DNA polymerase theta isoform 1 [Reticulomyxa filosa]